MSFEWRESFGYSTVVLDIFTSYTNGDGNSDPTINATGGRTGGPSFRYTATNSASNSGLNTALKAIPAGVTKYFALAYRTSVLPPLGGSRIIARFTQNGSTQVDMRINSQGDLFFTRAGTLLAGTTLTALVVPDVYIQLQSKVVFNNSTGSIDVRLHGATTSAYGGAVTGLDTVATATVTCDGVGLCSGGVVGNDPRTDDFCHPAVRNNDWMGDLRVDYFPGNGVGNSSQWTRSAGSNNYENIDETGSKDITNWNATSGVGNKDTFPTDNVPTTAQILEVCPMGLFSKQDAGSAECAFVVRQSGTDYDGANFSPPFGSNQYFKEGLELNPDTGSAWTPSEFNAGEIGYKRTT
jgi:hypothetical protein